MHWVRALTIMMQTPGRPGRPRKRASELRNTRTELRLTRSEKLRLVRAAALAGLDLSTWIRLKLKQAADSDLASRGDDIRAPQPE